MLRAAALSLFYGGHVNQTSPTTIKRQTPKAPNPVLTSSVKGTCKAGNRKKLILSKLQRQNMVFILCKKRIFLFIDAFVYLKPEIRVGYIPYSEIL